MTYMFMSTKPLRRGFTLIELLIVVAIIGILMSLAGMAVMSTVSGARVAATKATMTKVQRQLQSRIEAVSRAFRDQQSANQLFAEIAAVEKTATRAAGRFNPVKAALMRKVYMRAFLPQTWNEARFLLKRAGKTPPVSINPQPGNETESAEVLYFLLSDASIVGFTPANQDLFAGNEVRDTDKNGALEIVDGWGLAVRFYRWPTRLLRPAGWEGEENEIRATDAIKADDFTRAQILIEGLPTSLKIPPNRSTPTSLAQDPDDSLNVLVPGNGWISTTAQITEFESSNTSPFPFHTIFTWHSPLVVSSGPDRKFGIYDAGDGSHLGSLCEPYTSGPDQVFLYDNISNLNVRSGGK